MATDQLPLKSEDGGMRRLALDHFAQHPLLTLKSIDVMLIQIIALYIFKNKY